MIPEYKRLMIEFIKILDDVQTDDQIQLKRMVLANCRKQCPQFLVHMMVVFMAAEYRQPLMIEMKAGNGYRGIEAPSATPENMQSVRMAAGYSQKGKPDIMRTDRIKIFPCFAEHPPKPEKMEHKDRHYQQAADHKGGTPARWKAVCLGASRGPDRSDKDRGPGICSIWKGREGGYSGSA